MLRRLFFLLPLTVAFCGAATWAQPSKGGMFLTPRSIEEVAYNRTSVAVDPDGGLHAAFQLTAHAESKPVYYGYCPPGSDCTDPAAWAYVLLVDADLPFIELELTASGRPRLLLYNDFVIVNNQFRTHYVYAECDEGCTEPANWSVVDLGASEDGGGLDTQRRYNARRLALDPQGRPRFVYQYGFEWIGSESIRTEYLLACDVGCDAVGNWQAVRLPDYNFYDDLEESALAYAPDGRALLVTLLDGPNSQRWLGYLECAAVCDGPEDWSVPALILPMGENPTSRSWSLDLDDQGRPRVAAQAVGQPMAYAWCDGDCTASENWGAYTLSFSSEEEVFPSLALNSSGLPGLAFQQGTNLAYAWCEGNCETASPRWAGAVVESSSDLDTLLPSPVPGGCLRGTWIGGQRPQLAFRAGGDPVIGYDAEYLLECYRDPNNPNPGNTVVEPWWWASRVVFFTQPVGVPVAAGPVEPRPLTADLRAPYPNPARGAVSVPFVLSEPTTVRLSVYDILGREVALLLEDHRSAGDHALDWTPSGLPAGLYFLRLETASATAVRTLTVLH